MARPAPTEGAEQPPRPRGDDLAALVEAARAGDGPALDALLDAVGAAVWRAVRSILGGADAHVDDAAQEALLAFVDALPAFRRDSGVIRYACRIAVRTALALRRRDRRREALFTRYARDDGRGVSADPPGGSLAAERASVVRELVARLPPEQGEVLALRFVAEASLEEIAAETGVPVGTVSSRLRLAKRALLRELAAHPRGRELWGADE